MLGMFYQALWLRIGGRPWTYILRDTWQNIPTATDLFAGEPAPPGWTAVTVPVKPSILKISGF